MHALIIAPIHSGLLYVDSAKKLGADISIITTNTGEYAIADSLLSKVDNVVIVSDLQPQTLVDAATKLHATQPVTAVAAGVEFMVEQTAIVAQALGLPGLTPIDAETVRNKAKMRKRLQDSGVRTVRFAKAGTATDLDHVAHQIGFPAVIKPLQMAGSMGVVLVNNEVELLAAYEDILSDQVGWANAVPGSDALLEEFLVGTEYCVDGYVTQDGEIHVFEFVKVELGPQPHFQEIGYTAYRREDLEHADVLTEYITAVVRAMNISVGPFHSEVMLTKDGPVLIEIANRLPGDNLPLLTERATGISFADCALASLLGAPIPAPFAPKARVAASQFIIEPQAAGEIYTELAGWDDIAKDEKIDSTSIDIQPGERISAHQDIRSRVAEIQFHADSIQEAEAFRQKIVETIHVVRA